MASPLARLGGLEAVCTRVRDALQAADGAKEQLHALEDAARNSPWAEQAALALQLANRGVGVDNRRSPLAVEAVAAQLSAALDEDVRLDAASGAAQELEGAERRGRARPGLLGPTQARLTRGLNASTLALYMEVCLTLSSLHIRQRNLVGKLLFILARNVEGTAEAMDLSASAYFAKRESIADATGSDTVHMHTVKSEYYFSTVMNTGNALGQQREQAVQSISILKNPTERRVKGEVIALLKLMIAKSEGINEVLNYTSKWDLYLKLDRLIHESFLAHSLIQFSCIRNIEEKYTAYVSSLFTPLRDILEEISPEKVQLTSLNGEDTTRLILYVRNLVRNLFIDGTGFYCRTAKIIFEEQLMVRFVEQFQFLAGNTVAAMAKLPDKGLSLDFVLSNNFVLFVEILIKMHVLQTCIAHYNTILSRGNINSLKISGQNALFVAVILHGLGMLVTTVNKAKVPVAFAGFLLKRTSYYAWQEAIFKFLASIANCDEGYGGNSGQAEKIVASTGDTTIGDNMGKTLIDRNNYIKTYLESLGQVHTNDIAKEHEKLIQSYRDILDVIGVLDLEPFNHNLSDDRNVVFDANKFLLSQVKNRDFKRYGDIIKQITDEDMILSKHSIFRVYYKKIRQEYEVKQRKITVPDDKIGIFALKMMRVVIERIKKAIENTRDYSITVEEYNYFGNSLDANEVEFLSRYFSVSIEQPIQEMKKIEGNRITAVIFLKSLESLQVPFELQADVIFDESQSIGSYMQAINKVLDLTSEIENFADYIMVLDSIKNSGKLLNFTKNDLPSDFDPDTMISTWQHEKINSSNISAILAFIRCFSIIKSLSDLQGKYKNYKEFLEKLRSWFEVTTGVELSDKTLRQNRKIVNILDDLALASEGVLTIKEIAIKSQTNNTMKILNRIELCLQDSTLFSIFSSGKYHIFITDKLSTIESGDVLDPITAHKYVRLNSNEIDELRTYAQLMDNTDNEKSAFKRFKYLIEELSDATQLVTRMADVGYSGLGSLLKYNYKNRTYGFINHSIEDIRLLVQNEKLKLLKWEKIIQETCIDYPYLNIISASEFFKLNILANDKRDFELIDKDKYYQQIRLSFDTYNIPFRALYEHLSKINSNDNFIKSAGITIQKLFNQYKSSIYVKKMIFCHELEQIISESTVQNSYQNTPSYWHSGFHTNEGISSVTVLCDLLPVFLVQCFIHEGRVSYPCEVLFCSESTSANEIKSFFNLSYCESVNPEEKMQSYSDKSNNYVEDKQIITRTGRENLPNNADSLIINKKQELLQNETGTRDNGKIKGIITEKKNKALYIIVDPSSLNSENLGLVEDCINSPPAGKYSRLLIVNVYQGDSLADSSKQRNVINLRDRSTEIDNNLSNFIASIKNSMRSQEQQSHGVLNNVYGSNVSDVMFLQRKKMCKSREERLGNENRLVQEIDQSDYVIEDPESFLFVRSVRPGSGKTFYIKHHIVMKQQVRVTCSITSGDTDRSIMQRLEALMNQINDATEKEYVLHITITLFPGRYKHFIPFILQMYLYRDISLLNYKIRIPNCVRRIAVELRDNAYNLADCFTYLIKTIEVEMRESKFRVVDKNNQVKRYLLRFANMYNFCENRSVNDILKLDKALSEKAVIESISSFIRGNLSKEIKMLSFRGFKNMLKILSSFAEGLEKYLEMNKNMVIINRKLFAKTLFSNSILENLRIFNTGLSSTDYIEDLRASSMGELIDNLTKSRTEDIVQKMNYFFWVNQKGEFSYLYCNKLENVPESVKSIFNLIYRDNKEYVKRNSDSRIPPYIKQWDTLTEEDCMRDLWKLCGKKNGLLDTNDFMSLEAFKFMKRYALTYDNTLKMIQIFFRIQYNMPVGISGESGIGKTDLIRHLASIANADIRIMQVHAGTSGKDILKFLQDIERSILLLEKDRRVAKLDKSIKKKQKQSYISKETEELISKIKDTTLESIKAEEYNNNSSNFEEGDIRKRDVWIFFDEANATEDIHRIEQVIFERQIYEYKLPRYFKLIYALNPFRKNSEKESKLYEEYRYPSRIQTLSYTVFPLSQAMRETALNFGELQDAYYDKYVVKMIKYEKKFMIHGNQSITLTTDKRSALSQFAQKILCRVRPLLREYGVKCSLRELARFTYMFREFARKIYPFNIPQGHLSNAMLMKLYNSFFLVLKPFIQALGFVYYLRLPDECSKFKLRKFVADECQAFFKGLVLEEGFFVQWLYDDSKTLFDKFPLPHNITLNNTLRENLYVMLTTIRMKIPLIIIGKPGTSKTLAITLLDAECNGKDSKTPVLREQPNIHCVAYQGSKISTSESILYTFNKALELAHALNNPFREKTLQPDSAGNYYNYKHIQKAYDKNRVVFQFDEIGLAEQSGQKNALKTLHQMLEGGRGDEGGTVGFVGITNYSLDLAKLSRAVILIRSNLNRDDLIQTANMLMHNNVKYSKDSYANKYNNSFLVEGIVDGFLEVVETQKRYHHPEIYGMRNFYTTILQIKNKIEPQNIYTFDSNAGNSILNTLRDNAEYNESIFGGDKDDSASHNDRHQLLLIIKRNFESVSFPNISRIQPLEIFARHLNLQLPSKAEGDNAAVSYKQEIVQNIINANSRHILLIADNEEVLYDLFDIAQETGRTLTTMLKPGFMKNREDIASYTENQLKKIIILMDPEFEKNNGPQLLVLRKTESIFPSLYSLLNQHYTLSKGENSVLITVGGTSDDNHTVSENFRIITILTKTELPHVDVAFLNRFEIRNATVETRLHELNEEEIYIVAKCRHNLQAMAKVLRIDSISSLIPFYYGISDNADTINKDVNIISSIVYSAFKNAKEKYRMYIKSKAGGYNTAESGVMSYNKYLEKEIMISFLLASNPYLRLQLDHIKEKNTNFELKKSLDLCIESSDGRNPLNILSLKDGLSDILEKALSKVIMNDGDNSRNSLGNFKNKNNSVFFETAGLFLDLKVSSTVVEKRIGEVCMDLLHKYRPVFPEKLHTDKIFDIINLDKYIKTGGEEEFRDMLTTYVRHALDSNRAVHGKKIYLLQPGDNTSPHEQAKMEDKTDKVHVFLMNISESMHQQSLCKQLLGIIEEVKILINKYNDVDRSGKFLCSYCFILFISHPSKDEEAKNFWKKMNLAFTSQVTWYNLSTYLLKNPVMEIAFGLRSISSVLNDDEGEDDSEDDNSSDANVETVQNNQVNQHVSKHHRGRDILGKTNNLDTIVANIIDTSLQLSSYSRTGNATCKKFRDNFLLLLNRNETLRDIIKGIILKSHKLLPPYNSPVMDKMKTFTNVRSSGKISQESIISSECAVLEKLLAGQLAVLLEKLYSNNIMIPNMRSINFTLFNSLYDISMIIDSNFQEKNKDDANNINTNVPTNIKYLSTLPGFMDRVMKYMKRNNLQDTSELEDHAESQLSATAKQIRNLVYIKPISIRDIESQDNNRIRMLKLGSMLFNYEFLRVLYKFKLPDLDKVSGIEGEDILNFLFSILQVILPLNNYNWIATTLCSNEQNSYYVFRKSFTANLYYIMNRSSIPEYNFHDFFALYSQLIRTLHLVCPEKITVEIGPIINELESEPKTELRLLILSDYLGNKILHYAIGNELITNRNFEYKLVKQVINLKESLTNYISNINIKDMRQILYERLEIILLKLSLLIMIWKNKQYHGPYELTLNPYSEQDRIGCAADVLQIYQVLSNCSTYKEIWDLKDHIKYKDVEIFTEIFMSTFRHVLNSIEDKSYYNVDCSNNIKDGDTLKKISTSLHEKCVFLTNIIAETLEVVCRNGTERLSASKLGERLANLTTTDSPIEVRNDNRTDILKILHIFTALIQNLFKKFPLNKVHGYYKLLESHDLEIINREVLKDKSFLIFFCFIGGLKRLKRIPEWFYMLLIDEIYTSTGDDLEIGPDMYLTLNKIVELLLDSKNVSLAESGKSLNMVIFDIVIFRKTVKDIINLGNTYNKIKEGTERFEKKIGQFSEHVKEYSDSEKRILRQFLKYMCDIINKSKISMMTTINETTSASSNSRQISCSYQLCLILVQHLYHYYNNNIILVNKFIKHNTTLFENYFDEKRLYNRNGDILSNIHCNPFSLPSPYKTPGITMNRPADEKDLSVLYLKCIGHPPRKNYLASSILLHWMLSVNASGKSNDIRRSIEYINTYRDIISPHLYKLFLHLGNIERMESGLLPEAEHMCVFYGKNIQGDKQTNSDVLLLMSYIILVADSLATPGSYIYYLLNGMESQKPGTEISASTLYFPCMNVSSDYQLLQFFTSDKDSVDTIKGIIVCKGCNKIVQIIDNNCGLPGESGKKIFCEKCKNRGVTISHGVTGGKYGFECYSHYNSNPAIMSNYIAEMKKACVPQRGFKQQKLTVPQIIQDSSLGSIAPKAKAVLSICQESLMFINDTLRNQVSNQIGNYILALKQMLEMSEADVIVFLLAIVPTIIAKLNNWPVERLKTVNGKNEIETIIDNQVMLFSKKCDLIVRAFRASCNYKGDPYILRLITDVNYNYFHSLTKLYSADITEWNPIPLLHKLLKPMMTPTIKYVLAKNGKLDIMLRESTNIPQQKTTIRMLSSSRKLLQFIISNFRSFILATKLRSFLSACRLVKENIELLNLPISIIFDDGSKNNYLQQATNPSKNTDVSSNEQEQSVPQMLSNQEVRNRANNYHIENFGNIEQRISEEKCRTFNGFLQYMLEHGMKNGVQRLKNLKRDVIVFWSALPDNIDITMNDNECGKTAFTKSAMIVPEWTELENRIDSTDMDTLDFPISVLYPTLVGGAGEYISRPEDGIISNAPLPLLSSAAIRTASLEYNRFINMYQLLSNTNNIFDRLPFYLEQNNLVDDFDEDETNHLIGEKLNLNSTALSNLMPSDTISLDLLHQNVYNLPEILQDYLEDGLEQVPQYCIEMGISMNIKPNSWYIDASSLLSSITASAFANKSFIDTSMATIVNFSGNRNMDKYCMLVTIAENYGSDELTDITRATIDSLSETQGIELYETFDSIIKQLYTLISTNVKLHKLNETTDGVTIGEGVKTKMLTYMTIDEYVASLVDEIKLSMLYYAYEYTERKFGVLIIESLCPELFRESIDPVMERTITDGLKILPRSELLLLRNLLTSLLLRRLIPFNRLSSLDRHYHVHELNPETQLEYFIRGGCIVDWDYYEYIETGLTESLNVLSECNLTIYNSYALLVLCNKIL